MQLESDKGEVLLLQHKPYSFNVQKGWQLTCPIRFSNAHLGVSKNGGTPKSSILIGFSIINHLFWGTPIFGNTHILKWSTFELFGFRKSMQELIKEALNFRNLMTWKRVTPQSPACSAIPGKGGFEESRSNKRRETHTHKTTCWDLTHLSSLLQSSNSIF